MQFAVIKTGGKQYKVAQGDKILIEKLAEKEGSEFNFDEVLMVSDGTPGNTRVGTPLIDGAKVGAKVLAQGRSEKKIIFKFTHKTRYKKKKGHRQPFTKVEILKISA